MEITKQHTQDRQRRINYISENLRRSFDAGLDIESEKFIASMCLDLKVSRRTAREYIKTLCTAKGYDWVAGVISGPKPAVDIPESPKQSEIPKNAT